MTRRQPGTARPVDNMPSFRARWLCRHVSTAPRLTSAPLHRRGGGVLPISREVTSEEPYHQGARRGGRWLALGSHIMHYYRPPCERSARDVDVTGRQQPVGPRRDALPECRVVSTIVTNPSCPSRASCASQRHVAPLCFAFRRSASHCGERGTTWHVANTAFSNISGGDGAAALGSRLQCGAGGSMTPQLHSSAARQLGGGVCTEILK